MKNTLPAGSIASDYSSKTLKLIYLSWCEQKRNGTIDAFGESRLEITRDELKRRGISTK